jgi:acetylcholinesterase/cholinesterase
MLMKKPGKLSFAAAALQFLVLTAPEVTAARVSACTTGLVASKAGPVCGKLVTTASGKQASAFLGIPFAESTAQNQRWKPPVPKQPWTQTLAALQYGPMCPQFVLPSTATAAKPQQFTSVHHQHAQALNNKLFQLTGQSEDCLSLNIWTPSGTKPDAKLPVMVFIYGGGFSSGNSSYSLYDGSFLAANKDVILVTFNYRLGVLGFLATDELSGNYGFMDQQLALSWVQNTIRDFGGDPDKVTLFGESAGAMSVGLHLFSAPGSAKLFRAGIMESNFLALPYKSLEDQVKVGNIFKQGLNCRDLKCLQETSVNDLLRAQDAFTPQMSTVFSGAKYYIAFTPSLDGKLLTRQPVSAAEEGANKPILLGTNKDEAVMFVNGRPITPSDYSPWTASLFGLDLQKVIAEYPAQKNLSNSALWARVQTDNFLRCSSRYVAASATAPVYAYLFNHQPSFKVWGGQDCQTDENVCHGAELPFVFHNADKIGTSFTAEEEALSNTVIDYWVNFATYLNPNGNPAVAKGEVRWPEFRRHKKDFLVLNVPAVSVQNDPYREVCDFWDGIGYNLVEPWAERRR